MELADKSLWDVQADCQARGLPGLPRDELLGYLQEAAEALDCWPRSPRNGSLLARTWYRP
jgi:hypothetical protein